LTSSVITSLAGRRTLGDDFGRGSGFGDRGLIEVLGVWCGWERSANMHRRHDLPRLDTDREIAEVGVWKTNDFWLFCRSVPDPHVG
jgi:hypothetical protein